MDRHFFWIITALKSFGSDKSIHSTQEISAGSRMNKLILIPLWCFGFLRILRNLFVEAFVWWLSWVGTGCLIILRSNGASVSTHITAPACYTNNTAATQPGG